MPNKNCIPNFIITYYNFQTVGSISLLMCVTFSSLTLHFLPQVWWFGVFLYTHTHTQRQYSVPVFPPCPFIWGHVQSNLSIFVCHNVLVLILRSRLLAQQWQPTEAVGSLSPWLFVRSGGGLRGQGLISLMAPHSTLFSRWPQTLTTVTPMAAVDLCVLKIPKSTQNKISRVILLPPSLAPIPQQTHICINYCMRIMLTKLHRHSCGIGIQ